MAITLKTETYGITACAKSKKSAFGVRGFHEVSVSVPITKLPVAVIEKLLEDALTKKLRAALANLDKNTVTEDEVRAAMTAAFDNLVTSTKAKRTQSRSAKIRSLARSSIREALVAKFYGDNEPNKEEVTAFLKKMFDSYDKWVKNPEAHENLAANGRYVQNAIDAADRRLSEQEAIASDFDTLVADFAETKAAATATTPAARPTPTQRVKKARANAPQGGPSA